MSAVAGFTLLFVLSVNWTRYQGRGGRWTTQVGLSVLWTLYAAAALAWGFIRSRPAVRYAALALFGLAVFKVFFVDLAAVRTAYRILSFLVLGVVLLLVSLLYQKARRPSPTRNQCSTSQAKTRGLTPGLTPRPGPRGQALMFGARGAGK